jgi:hypothetical protein
VSRLFLIAGGVLLFAQACTVVVAGDDAQCATDEDCVARGFDNASCVEKVCVGGDGGGGGVTGDPVWGCLGNVTEPTPDPTKTVEFEIRLAYAVGGSAVSTDTVVDICDKLDITCMDNDPKFPKGLNPDPAGIVDLSVPEGFDGFVQVTGPNLVDSRIYVGRPIVDLPPVEEVQLFSPTDINLLSTLAGEEPDPTRGTAIVLVVDCSGEGVGGVRFETPNSDSDSLQFYLINQSPTIPPTATATDGDGFGGFFNLPVSSAVVRAFRDEDDVFIGESSFQVLADTISYVLVAPTPE